MSDANVSPDNLPPADWEPLIDDAARLGFIVRYEHRDDGRWAASFDRLDDPRVLVFTAASEERLAMQVAMSLDIARRAVRGHVLRKQDRW